jgi:hypothetical protein
MPLYFIKISAQNDCFSVLENTFQGQKYGCKDFSIHIKQLQKISELESKVMKVLTPTVDEFSDKTKSLAAVWCRWMEMILQSSK